MSTNDVNDYIQFKLLKYKYFKPINNDMQEQYKEDFADFMEATFKACSLMTIYNLQTLFYNYRVWVKKDKQATIAWSLYNTLCKEH